MAGTIIRYGSTRTGARPRRKRPGGGFFLIVAAMIGLGAYLGYSLDLQGGVPSPSRDERVTEIPPLQALASLPQAAARGMPVCGSARRVNCVVDGDTIWVDREKIRLLSINAPEVRGSCARERRLADQATRRLSQLLSGQPFTIARDGVDRYGRTLATVSTREGDVGMVLVSEGLSHVWRGRKESWC